MLKLPVDNPLPLPVSLPAELHSWRQQALNQIFPPNPPWAFPIPPQPNSRENPSSGPDPFALSDQNAPQCNSSLQPGQRYSEPGARAHVFYGYGPFQDFLYKSFGDIQAHTHMIFAFVAYKTFKDPFCRLQGYSPAII